MTSTPGIYLINYYAPEDVSTERFRDAAGAVSLFLSSMQGLIGDPDWLTCDVNDDCIAFGPRDIYTYGDWFNLYPDCDMQEEKSGSALLTVRTFHEEYDYVVKSVLKLINWHTDNALNDVRLVPEEQIYQGH